MNIPMKRKRRDKSIGRQLEFFDPDQVFGDWEKARIRRLIFESLAGTYGVTELDAECVCPECGKKILCVIHPIDGRVALWCSYCDWFADGRWLLSDKEESNV